MADDDGKTAIYDKRRANRATKRGILDDGEPTEVDEPPSAPVRAISMKTPGAIPKPVKPRPEAKPHQVQLRPLGRADTPQNLGRIAPPRDPREVRARRMRDLVIWGCVVVMLASVVMLAVWFLARR